MGNERPQGKGHDKPHPQDRTEVRDYLQLITEGLQTPFLL